MHIATVLCPRHEVHSSKFFVGSFVRQAIVLIFLVVSFMSHTTSSEWPLRQNDGWCWLFSVFIVYNLYSRL